MAHGLSGPLAYRIFPEQGPNHVPCIVRRIFNHWKENESFSVMSDSLWPHELYSSWNSPGQNTGVGSLSLLQGIFPTQGSNPGLPYFRWIFYQLSHKETLTLTNGPSGKYKFPFIDGKSHLYFNKDIIVLFIHVNLN